MRSHTSSPSATAFSAGLSVVHTVACVIETYRKNSRVLLFWGMREVKPGNDEC